jgi:hypothetical protein
MTAHNCSFPCNPAGGTFASPGPCECGKTYARSEAERMLAEAVAAMAATDPGGGGHGQTVYDAHHAVMHQQTGRRQSHHKAYENLTAPVRARYTAAGQAVAGPLEAEITRLLAALEALGRPS